MSKITLIITGNDEQYTYDAATDTMQGAGEWLEMMNNIIATAGYGDNPYQQIAELMRDANYTVKYEYTPDAPEVIDGI